MDEYFEIPWRNDPLWSMDLTLNGTLYEMKAKWWPFYEFWTVDLLQIDQTEIFTGLKLVYGADLFAQFQNVPGMPEGQLYCVHDDETERQPPGRYAFQEHASVIYVQPAV